MVPIRHRVSLKAALKDRTLGMTFFALGKRVAEFAATNERGSKSQVTQMSEGSVEAAPSLKHSETLQAYHAHADGL